MVTTTDVAVERYEPAHRDAWDDFVRSSKNGLFLFERGYMEYHADRFADASLVFFNDDRRVALLPAHLREGVLVSHGGLTFGGLVVDERMRTPLMLEVMGALRATARELGAAHVVYKAVPHIYHRVPAEEDLYALHRHGARLVRRDVSSAIRLTDRVRPSKGRKWALKQAQKAGVEVSESTDFETFMHIEADLLQSKYGVVPTHSAAELRLLAERFPTSIRLFGAFRGESMLGGIVVYASTRVAHAQYIAATDEGKAVGAVDAIVAELVDGIYADCAYFDFGISTERDGSHLNTSLIENKEGFGARAVVHDTYELGAG